jgi:uncharacterized protein YdeI (YjbR/CyaY-like superfamily)
VPADDPPTIAFESPAELEAWLEANHCSDRGLWIKFAKKASGIPSVTYAEALEIALSYGWIDGTRRRFDERWFVQRFTPRRARSKWSKINREKAERLIAEGRMRPAGLSEVERARADGRWDAAYDSPGNIQVPDDLRRELDSDPAAREFFESLDSTNRYAILYRLHDAKRADTRERRLRQFVAMLKERRKIHP